MAQPTAQSEENARVRIEEQASDIDRLRNPEELANLRSRILWHDRAHLEIDTPGMGFKRGKINLRPPSKGLLICFI